MKIITIVGARPQFIKASSLSREIAKHKNVKEIIVHTGQHFNDNMSSVFFDEMQIPSPKYNLNINNLSHSAMTGEMLVAIEKILLSEKPDWVLVYGDTNSTIAGALAASKLQIKVAHVEAGLRSFDMNMPEEINRVVTDQISKVLFCPTETAVNNLLKEGINSKNASIVNCGDIMYESALHYRDQMKKPLNFEFKDDFVLATIHRQENTDSKEKLTQIINSFNDLVAMGENIVMPIHPRTKKCIEAYNLQTNFETIEPIGYLEMLYLLDKCKIVITDSGGLQKEAYFFSKYCITLRDTTEWVELVDNNVNSLLKIDLNLTNNLRNLLVKKIDNSSSLYGKGNSSKLIIKHLIRY